MVCVKIRSIKDHTYSESIQYMVYNMEGNLVTNRCFSSHYTLEILFEIFTFNNNPS